MKKTSVAGGLPLARLSHLGSQISRTQRLWILTAAMLLAAAAIGILAILGPWQESRRQTGSQLEQEQRRSKLLVSIQRKRDSLQKTEQELLLEGGTPALTSQVSRLATQSQVAIDSVTPQPDLSVPPYTQFQIEIEATARPDDLLAFLRSMESRRPLLLLNEMEIGEQPSKTLPPAETTETQRIRLKIGAVGRLKKAP